MKLLNALFVNMVFNFRIQTVGKREFSIHVKYEKLDGFLHFPCYSYPFEITASLNCFYLFAKHYQEILMPHDYNTICRLIDATILSEQF